MKKSGLIKLIALIIALSIVLGLLYWLSSGFTEPNVKRWGVKRDSSAAYVIQIGNNADKHVRDMEVYFEKETTIQEKAR